MAITEESSEGLFKISDILIQNGADINE